MQRFDVNDRIQTKKTNLINIKKTNLIVTKSLDPRVRDKSSEPRIKKRIDKKSVDRLKSGLLNLTQTRRQNAQEIKAKKLSASGLNISRNHRPLKSSVQGLNINFI